MPRPQKFKVDYFSHDANAGKGRTLTILFNNFGHEGISTWWLLLEEIASTNNHVIGIRNPESLEYLASKLHLLPQKLLEVLAKMAEVDAIDKELFPHGYIWSQNFVDRLEAVYKTRNQPLPKKPEVNHNEKPIYSIRIPINSSRYTHTKGTILNYTKETKERGSGGERNEGKKKEDVFHIELPEFIDRETWQDFVTMRMTIKAPLTIRAQKSIITKLEGFKKQGMDPNKVLEQSIISNWKGVWPLKEVGHGTHQQNPERGGDRTAELEASLRRFRGEPE